MILRKLATVIVAVATTLALVLPGAAGAPSAKLGGLFDRSAGLDDVDTRTGSVQPSGAQRAIVGRLGAKATWNDFGTPRSLIRYGGYLATGLSGADAEAAARNFAAAHRDLFRIDPTTLETVSSAPLVGSDGHAVTFRQTFGGHPAAEGGLLTVGLEGSPAAGWKVAYASSSTTGDTALAAQPQLSATEAWARAAANVGRAVGPAAIGTVKDDREWKTFGVDGFAHPQRARLVAVPTAQNGVRPAFETLVLDDKSGEATGYHHFVDAVSGAVLVRKNLVENSHPPADEFTGTMPPIDTACDVEKGPWIVGPEESVGSVSVAAEAILSTNDIVLHLLRDGTIVQSQDTVFSPEALVYDPPDDGQGIYTVQVCDFGDGAAWGEPLDYRGQITFNAVGPGDAAPFPPKWEVFPAYPELGGQTHPWNYPSTDIREVWCWQSSVGNPPSPLPECDREVENLASRVPWDFSPRLNAPTFTTQGNNASTAEAWTDPLFPGATAFRPFSPDRDYRFGWANSWHSNDCFEPFISGVSHDIAAAVTNLFVMHNRMHDWSYFLGFTERAWNSQDSNFGTGGTAENDPVLGDAQAGALTGGPPSYLGRDNANMRPLPDGVSPITNMYLWQPWPAALYTPCVDGDYDMGIIAHEYGHLIENRMIGKGGTRSGHHAGAMGESSGDLLGVEYLNEYGFVPVSGENPRSLGTYATANHLRAIRNYNMDSPRTGRFPEESMTPEVNPLNFSDMGYDSVGQQVHANGEIWSATNNDIREALEAKYNATFPATNQQLQNDCADGVLPASQCPGNRRWIQIMFDAYLLMPAGPTMLDARDAYLAADLMRFGGANQAELWKAFATRGFGEGAFSSTESPENTPASDTDPVPDFSSPLHNEATVTFTAGDEAGQPVPARVYVGHYEARVSPIADTDPATSGSPNLDGVAAFVPGDYEFVANAPGYGHVRFRETLAAGATSITIPFQTNHASKANGASATGEGAELDALIDDTEATNWDFDGAGTDVDVAQPEVTVDLAGDQPVAVDRVQVSALLFGQGRYTALRKFEILACSANCGSDASFSSILTSADDAFPGFNPRPVAPEVILRSFDVTDTNATHLRIRVLENQCTGDADFQGEQDSDPTNGPTGGTDCRTGSTLQTVPADDEVHISELQVFGPVAPSEPQANLAIEKTDNPDPVQRGKVLTYTITVTNGGPEAAAGVSVVDQLPKGAGFGSATSTQGTCGRPRKGLITCTIGDMAAGQQVTITIKIKPPDQGTITNTATVSATSPEDPDPSDNSDSEQTVVQ
jgi:extracellular elastinolytic metalloproteinase